MIPGLAGTARNGTERWAVPGGVLSEILDWIWVVVAGWQLCQGLRTASLGDPDLTVFYAARAIMDATCSFNASKVRVIRRAIGTTQSLLHSGDF